jgi:hypothetical protein
MAKANFELLGWGAVENTTHDVGTDLFLMARDARRFDLGLLVGAQVKSGSSYFRSPAYDESGTLIGWWFPSDQDHFDAWLSHSIPHVIVLQSLETRVSYWAHITQQAVVSTGRNSKILVPVDQVVDEAHREALLAVATSQRPAVSWEGSAWTGAKQLAQADVLRYAMVVPRLVAPHPNAGFAEVTPEECLAMVVLVRLEELREGRTLDPATVPTMVAAKASPEWRWQLVVALHTYLENGDPSPLVPLARAAVDAADVAAGAVTATAALLECGRAADALELLEEVIDRDVVSPVDHAWLQAQLARAYADAGRLLEARNLALEVQTLRSEFPHDASATAIAGAAAQLVFTLSDFDDTDLARVITASDSTATWWRTQVLAWGLGHESDQRFVAWAGGHASGRGLNELRAASLMSGFTGDQGGWRRAISLVGRHRLLLTTAASPTEEVAGHLRLLRLAGDERNLKAATAHVQSDGPAAAATTVAHQIDLTMSTRTTAHADLAFLAAAGDVVAEVDADRHMAWALATLDQPEAYVDRLKPTFLMEHAVLQLVRSLLRAAGVQTRRAVIEHVLSLPAEQDQLTANGWASVVRAVPLGDWTAEDAHRAADRAGAHHWELEYALLEVAAPYEMEVTTRLLAEAAQGNFKAFDALGDVRDLPTASASALATVAVQRIVDQREQVRVGGGYGMGGTDWAWWLTAINVCHPTEGDWPALIEHLNDSSAHPDHLTGAVGLLAAHARELSPERIAELLPAVDQLLHRRSHPWRTTNLEAIAKWASLRLQICAGQADDAQLYGLLAGTPTDRETAALLIGLREDASQLPTLAALAFDTSPIARSGAAEALGLWAAHDVGGDHVHTLVTELLRDAGTRTARGVVSGLSRATNLASVEPHKEDLLTHASAQVRHRTQQLLDRLSTAD